MGEETKAGKGTEGLRYTDRLRRLESQKWKKLLDAQAPYRWNVQRLFGDREVLDIGCGIGRNLAHLGNNGVGVDHNETSIKECRARGLNALTTVEFPDSEYAKPERFGGLLAAHLIEHMRRPQAVEILSEYIPCLAPQGKVVFICPQEKGYASDETHVEFTDFDGLADVATQLGLTVTKRMSFPFPRPAGKVFLYNEFVLVATK